jgi:hypothetical protein
VGDIGLDSTKLRFAFCGGEAAYFEMCLILLLWPATGGRIFRPFLEGMNKEAIES